MSLAIVERGVRALIPALFVVFNGPIGVGMLGIAAVMLFVFGEYMVTIFITIGIYVWFTFGVTEWRVKLRRKMNEQDTDANQRRLIAC